MGSQVQKPTGVQRNRNVSENVQEEKQQNYRLKAVRFSSLQFLRFQELCDIIDNLQVTDMKRESLTSLMTIKSRVNLKIQSIIKKKLLQLNIHKRIENQDQFLAYGQMNLIDDMQNEMISMKPLLMSFRDYKCNELVETINKLSLQCNDDLLYDISIQMKTQKVSLIQHVGIELFHL